MDEFYAKNPHLLPAGLPTGHRDPPPHLPTNFASNFVQVSHPDSKEDKDIESASLLHLATIMEVTDEDEPPGPTDPAEDLEPGHINRLVEVLQARAKEIRDSKRWTDTAKTFPNSNRPADNQPDNARLDENRPVRPSLPVPEVAIPPRPSPSKPLPTTLSSFPGVTPQFKYSALVESNVDTTAVINQVLAEKVFLLVKELLALSPKVRKYFKEATTTKRLPALPTAGTHTVSTFSLGADQELHKAVPTLPLRIIDVILNGTTPVTGILDSGCQVVIIRRDIWEKLAAPLKQD